MVKVSIGINSELTFKEDFQKFKKELLDETSKNGKITLQEKTLTT